MARKKKNRRKRQIRLLTVDNERKVVRSGLTMLGFASIFGWVVLMTWVAAKITDPATLPIRGVKVEGDFKYLHTETLEQLVVSEVHSGFFTVDVDRIQASVLSAPWVHEVTVRKLWPDSLYVTIQEQRAVVRWGDRGFLNAQGELFEPENMDQPQGLIRLEGPYGTEQQVYKKYKHLVSLLKPLQRNVIWVRLNNRRGWSFGIDEGPKVMLGKKEVDTRISRYIWEVEKNFGQNLDTITLVDLRYTNGFTIRRKMDDQEVEILTELNRRNDTRGT